MEERKKILHIIIENHHLYDLPDFVFKMREALNVSRHQVMKDANSGINLGNLERNKVNPSRETLVAISKYFKVPFKLIAIKAAKLVSDNYYTHITLGTREQRKRREYP